MLPPPPFPVADPNFPGIRYRQTPAGQPVPMLQDLGIRVQTLVVCHHDWGMNPAQLAEDYSISEARVEEALAFYQTYRAEIDASIQSESDLAPAKPADSGSSGG